MAFQRPATGKSSSLLESILSLSRDIFAILPRHRSNGFVYNFFRYRRSLIARGGPRHLGRASSIVSDRVNRGENEHRSNVDSFERCAMASRCPGWLSIMNGSLFNRYSRESSLGWSGSCIRRRPYGGTSEDTSKEPRPFNRRPERIFAPWNIVLRIARQRNPSSAMCCRKQMICPKISSFLYIH